MEHTHSHTATRYTCPMHPEIIRDAPGKCPLCGMELVPVEAGAGKATQPAHEGHGGDPHAGHHARDFLKRFRICLLLTIPVLLLSHTVRQWMGWSVVIPGEKYLLLLFSTWIYFYGGMPFLKGMLAEIKHRATGMMTLVAIAITVAFVYSVAVVAGLKGMDFFWELATLIDIMLLGHWLEMRSQMAASRALEGLVALLPSQVHVERNGDISDIPLQDLRNGDLVLVKPGEKIPADGEITEGSSYLNESMLTGESAPVKKEPGNKVIGGSLNGDGAIRVKVTATGRDSYLNKVIGLVQSARQSKSKTQGLADQVAKWLTIISITVGVITFAYWFSREHDLAFAMERMVTVMVTACPHALGVAIPLVVAISTALSATHGLLIRNRNAFESARTLDTVIFDKTGTLTRGIYEVNRIIPLNTQYTENELLQYAASVQQQAGHPVSSGLIRKVRERGLPTWPLEQFSYVQGIGVEGLVNRRSVISAGPNYFRQHGLPVPALPPGIDQNAETVSYLLIDRQPAAIFTLADSIRPSSAAAIQALQQMHIQVYLLTGDNESLARSIADKLGMNGYFANVLPHEKQEKVRAFQAEGKQVAMTGDGINDAPALAQADVGIAIGSGTDVAAETADLILVNSDPADVADMIAFSRATYRKMIQNLAWALGYNLVAIPLAAGILYPRFMLSPAMGAVLMTLSTIIVAFNAELLKSGFRQIRG